MLFESAFISLGWQIRFRHPVFTIQVCGWLLICWLFMPYTEAKPFLVQDFLIEPDPANVSVSISPGYTPPISKVGAQVEVKPAPPTEVKSTPAKEVKPVAIVEATPILSAIAIPRIIDSKVNASSSISGRTLLDSYNQALANDPIFKAAIKDQEATAANLTIGRSAVLPKLSASSFMSTNRLTNTYTGGVSQTFDNYPSSNNYIQILQPLFDMSSFAKYRQGMYQKNFGDAKFEADTYDLLVRVTQAYLNVLYSEDLITFLTSQRDSYQAQMNVAKKSFRYGEMSKIDYLEAKSAYENSLYQLLDAEQQSKDVKRKLGVLVGEGDINLLKINKLSAGKKYLVTVPGTFQQLLDTALIQNLELIAGKHKLDFSKEEINKTSANYYPQISAVANWSRQNSFSVNTVNVISNQALAGIQASWPIFSSGETLGQTRQAAALYEKAKEEYEGLKLNTGVELEKYYDQMNLYNSKIVILESTLQSLQEAKKATVYGVAAGIRSNLDVLVAIKNIFNTQKDLAQARYSYIISCVKVLQLSGLLKIKDLENISALYFSGKP
ncbi:hypothetical protein CBI30_07355 [Polynucleobacter aenigmaticus]|uniref:Type I secretion protein TolC n=1 Tax=Polynucleobacter aenigmaticus TaxID=1743164 RepID=A0A254Q142_9BURK|nr:TolC family outer membrane protein [Polynucleobacter aenigmaticus]OWS71256.1 hypothetical protein CBI30_07355 [Polynucleobacter aenigmaticus]